MERLDAAVMLLEMELSRACDTKCAPLSADLRRIIFSGGKRIRPRLAWLCAKIGGANTQEILPLMAVLELAHTASLIHDDVVDGAPFRRGAETIHILRGRAAAVHCGDYLLGKAALYARKYANLELDAQVADIACEMCVGEYMQQETAWVLSAQTQEHYMQRIRRKTALFFQGCCIAGAKVGALEEDTTERLGAYGLNLGMAFQITDDLLDYSDDVRSGKKAGQDLRCGIFNLPFLCAVAAAPSPEHQMLAQRRRKTDADIAALTHYVAEAGGIRAAEGIAADFIQKALDALAPLPDGSERECLIHIANALQNRTC